MENLRNKLIGAVAGATTLLGIPDSGNSLEAHKLPENASPKEIVLFLKNYTAFKEKGGDLYESFVVSTYKKERWWSLAKPTFKDEISNAFMDNVVRELNKKAKEKGGHILWEFHNHPANMIEKDIEDYGISRKEVKDKNKLMFGPSKDDCRRINSQAKSHASNYTKSISVIVETEGFWVCSASENSKIYGEDEEIQDKVEKEIDDLQAKLCLNIQNAKSQEEILNIIKEHEEKYFEISGVKIKFLSFDTPENEILEIGEKLANE